MTHLVYQVSQLVEKDFESAGAARARERGAFDGYGWALVREGTPNPKHQAQRNPNLKFPNLSQARCLELGLGVL